MKTEETYCVFLPNGIGGPEVTGVFVSESSANDACSEEREKRRKQMMKNTSKLSEAKLKNHEEQTDYVLLFSVTVTTLDKALEKIRDAAFDAGMWTETPDESY